MLDKIEKFTENIFSCRREEVKTTLLEAKTEEESRPLEFTLLHLVHYNINSIFDNEFDSDLLL
jgi:hypothetical protein